MVSPFISNPLQRVSAHPFSFSAIRFSTVNWEKLHFPAKFLIDYVRIWQPEDEENIGCDRE
jgi:hypothetical protein